jgi:GT2 family glycosyltransferase
VSDPPEGAGSRLGATVVVPTFRRLASLRRTLEALVAQRHPGVDWDVVVVDNDDGPDAANVIQELAARMPVPSGTCGKRSEGRATPGTEASARCRRRSPCSSMTT